jgi:predicted nuclease with TOPRIM domain
MAVVKECRNAMNGFKGWYVEAQKHLKQENDLRNKLEQATRRSEEIREVRSDLKMKNLRLAEMEKDLHKMVTENNKLLVESKDLFDEVENYRKQVVALSQPSKNLQPNLATPSYGQTDKWRRETIILQHSYSFRLGQILINAFTKPGKNTYMMPYYLVKLVWDMITGRGREQLQKALQGKA